MNVTFVIEFCDIFEIRHLRIHLYSPVCIFVKSNYFLYSENDYDFFFLITSIVTNIILKISY